MPLLADSTPSYLECTFTVIFGLLLTQIEGIGRKLLAVVVYIFFVARTSLVHDLIPAGLNKVGRDSAETKSAREHAQRAQLLSPVILRRGLEDPTLDRDRS